MNCPVCKENAMITLELNEVEIDYCTACAGIWLDAGELEILLGGPDKEKALLDSLKTDSGVSENIRRCPICDKNMQKVIVGSSGPALLIDKCARGDGLWFDKGELNTIFGKAQLDKDNKIQQLLTDMFGHN